MGWIKRKDAELFADQVEEALDTILSGRELKEPEEVTEDTLWGKCGEKFWRLSQVWNTKETQTIQEKKQMKSLISDISHQTKIPLAKSFIRSSFRKRNFLRKVGYF